MKKTLVFACLTALVFLISLGVWRFTERSNQPNIPQNITNQLPFTAYTPEQNGYKIAPSTIKYNAQTEVLSLVIKKAGGVDTSLTQQALPETLIYDKLVASMNQQRSIGTKLGNITITHPSASPGKEVAVAEAGQTLMFASVDAKLPDDSWRLFFNSLTSVK